MQTNVQHVAALRILLDPASPIQSKDAIKMHAAALENNGKMFADMFPEGSTAPTSRAKAEIWSMKSDFATALKNFANAGKALDEAAEKGDNVATLAAVNALNATCGGCHTTFRGPALPPPAPPAGGGGGGGGGAPAPN